MIFVGKNIDIKEWQGESLGHILAIDTETERIPFTETPDIITCQVYDRHSVYYIPLALLDSFFEKHSTNVYVFANAPFDLDVLEKACNWDYSLAVNEGRVFDVQILYRLYKLATKGVVPFKYSLQLLAKEYLGEELDKDDDIRCGWEQFRNTPFDKIPENFLEYGAKDVVTTYEIYQSILYDMGILRYENYLSHHIQLKGAIALNQIYKNGIGFNEKRAKKFLDNIYNELKKCQMILSTYGWIRGEKGAKNRFDDVASFLDLDIPKTDDGHFTTKEKELYSYKKHHFIKTYLKYISLEKTTTFIRNLSGTRVHPRYNLLKNTGRTSCSKPNFQQLPRAGEIRSMFEAKEGHTFIITDYAAIELCTLAQELFAQFGNNEMRNRINSGEDLHKYYASVLYEVPIEKVTKDQRQAAKAANFGFPGGLGIETFTEFAEGYGLNISLQKAQTMKDKWFTAFPKMKKYLQGEKGSVTTLTGRMRAYTSYCAEKNTPFQGLAADGAKLALYDLYMEGFTLVGFVHDEIISEVPIEKAEELKRKQEEIMITAMEKVVPDVNITVESVITKEYCK